MTAQLSQFAARLRLDGALPHREFNERALELFGLQFEHNPAYRKICEGRRRIPASPGHWTQIPFVPTAAFKEWDLSGIPPEARTGVFHSSGTTEQKPSRHFHSPDSLNLYETALWASFRKNVIEPPVNYDLLVLTPPPELVPHSSLVHMFKTIQRKLGALEPVYAGDIAADGAWVLDFAAALAALENGSGPKLILGTAFSFVHLLDFLADKNRRLHLPAQSRVMETGGYKNRSRTMPKAALHSLITRHLGVLRENIICEYGMSELSSQAYDSNPERHFHFPSWTRAQIISPETGAEMADGETGLIRIFDLANVFSVAAIQTEDLAVRRGDGFELLGRAALAEPRGCSLMTA